MTRLTCGVFVERVTDFLDGALGPTAELELVEHAASCLGCDRYLDQMRRVIALTTACR